MTKLLLTMAMLFPFAFADAATLNCFTKFWGESTATISGPLDEETFEANFTFKIDGEGFSQEVSSPVEVRNGKYKGMLSYSLGTVKGAGYDGGSVDYYLYVPANFPVTKRFAGLVYSDARDGYGSRPTKVLCSIRSRLATGRLSLPSRRIRQRDSSGEGIACKK